MAIDFTGMAYRHESTNVEIPLDSLPAATWVNAFVKCADHVFGNELASVVTNAKAKNGGALSDAEKGDLVKDFVSKRVALMVAGTWGEKGSRAPRVPGESEYDTIRNQVIVRETLKVIAKQGLKEGAEKRTWIGADGATYTLAQCMGAFLSHPVLGEERTAAVDEAATRILAARKAEAEAAAKAKEREAKLLAAGNGQSGLIL